MCVVTTEGSKNVILELGGNPDDTGGIIPYVINLAKYLHSFDFRPTIICATNGDELRTISEVILVSKNKKINGYKYFFELCLKVRRLKISSDVIIHTQSAVSAFPFILFHKKNPKICTLHGKNLEGLLLKHPKLVTLTYKIIEAFSLKHVDRLIAVDETTKQFYEQSYPWLVNKITIIPIGIDLKEFKPMDREKIRKKYGLNLHDKIVMYAGRLEKEKNLDFLIRSISLINDVNVKLIIVGEGRQHKHLKELVQNLKLERIYFIGALHPKKIPELLNCADIFAITSLYESGPLVIMEALACGIPVVTVNVGRVKEFIQNQYCGKIVERDEQKFANALIDVLEMDKIKTTAMCISKARNFSFETTGKKNVDIYNEVW